MHIGMFPTRSRARGQRERDRDGGAPIPTDHHCASFVALNPSFIFIARVGTRNRFYVRTKDRLCFRNVNSFIMNVSDIEDYIFLVMYIYMILPFNLPQHPCESLWNIFSWI